MGVRLLRSKGEANFPAQLCRPGSHNRAPNSLWYIAPERTREIYDCALEAGIADQEFVADM